MSNNDISNRRDEYNTGGNIDLKSLPPEKLEAALDSLSEGNASLRRLLSICLEKGITTCFSCGGHKDAKFAGAYVTFQVDEVFMEHIKGIFSELGDKTGFNISFSNNGLRRMCSVRGKYGIREEIFDIICNGIEHQKENLEVADDFEKLLSLSESLENREYEYHIGISRGRLLTKLELLDGCACEMLTRFRNR